MLSSIAGECLELDVVPQTTVLGLKERLAEAWRVPPSCQKLISGTAVLCNSQVVATLCGAPAQICITMLVSLDEVMRKLEKPSHGRQSALATLAKLGPRGGDVGLQVVGACLQDADPEVRRMAADASVHVAQVGDEPMLEALRARLLDTDVRVRSAALRSLARVAPRGDARALHECARHLEDEDKSMREAALEALAESADPGQEVLCEVCGRLGDSDAGVRGAAVKALFRLDDDAAATLERWLEHEDPDVRCGLLRALGEFAPRAGANARRVALALVTGAAKDPDEGVRLRAREAAAWLVNRPPPAEALWGRALDRPRTTV